MKKLLWLLFLVPAVALGQFVPPAASQAEVNAGTVKNKYVSPYTLAGSSFTNSGITAAQGTNIVSANAIAKLNGFGTNTTLTYLVVTNPAVAAADQYRWVKITNGLVRIPAFNSDRVDTEPGLQFFGTNGSEKAKIFTWDDHDGTANTPELLLRSDKSIALLPGYDAVFGHSDIQLGTYQNKGGLIKIVAADAPTTSGWTDGLGWDTNGHSYILAFNSRSAWFGSYVYSIPGIMGTAGPTNGALVNSTLQGNLSFYSQVPQASGGSFATYPGTISGKMTATNGWWFSGALTNTGNARVGGSLNIGDFNQGNATVALGVDGATGLLTTNNVPGGVGGTTYAFVNTNRPAGEVTTNGSAVMIGTNVTAASSPFPYTLSEEVLFKESNDNQLFYTDTYTNLVWKAITSWNPTDNHYVKFRFEDEYVTNIFSIFGGLHVVNGGMWVSGPQTNDSTITATEFIGAFSGSVSNLTGLTPTISTNLDWETLTDGATITWTYLSNETRHASVTLGGNRTLALSGDTGAAQGTLVVYQDGTGNRTLALPAGSLVNGNGGGVVLLSTAPGSIDKLHFQRFGTNYLWEIGNLYN